MGDCLQPNPPTDRIAAPTGREAASALRVAAVVVIVAAYLVLVWRFNWLTDDAFISFRYARNLTQGLGLRFNANENPPVEGYSNFLWVVALAPFERLQWDVTVAARVLSVLCGAALLWRVAFVLRRYAGASRPAGAAAVLWLATLPVYVIWSTSGLETMPFALLLFLTYELLVLHDSAGAAAGVAGVALSLMRPEGVFWAMFLGALRATCARTASDRGAFRRVISRYAAVLLLGCACFWGWRLAYYRQLLANTASGRMSSPLSIRIAQGWDYVRWALWVMPPLVVLAPAGVVCLRRGSRALATSLLMLLAVAGYTVLVGGDHMRLLRFLVPALPFAAVVAGVALSRLGRTRGGCVGAIAAAGGAMALNVFSAYPIQIGGPQGFTLDSPFAPGIRKRSPSFDVTLDRWIRMGRALAAHTTPDDSIILGAIGAIGYHSRLHVYDRFGLIDARVTQFPFKADATPAHQREAPMEYFDVRRPTIFDARIVHDPAWKSGPRQLQDAAYVNKTLAIVERLSVWIYPLETLERFEAGEALLLIRRTGEPVPAGVHLPRLGNHFVDTTTEPIAPLSMPASAPSSQRDH